jgi:hypothetical protein
VRKTLQDSLVFPPALQTKNETAFLINIATLRQKCKKLKAPEYLYRVGAK